MGLRIADYGLRMVIAATLFIGHALPGSAETIDRVLAVAAGQIITLSDVNAARDLGIVSSATGPDLVRGILNQLIDRELMLAEVDRYAPPEPSAETVDRELAALRARFPTAAVYQETLSRSGIDERHVRELVRQTLRIRAYQDQRFSATDPRRQTAIDEWLAGLRRRGDVVDIYATVR